MTEEIKEIQNSIKPEEKSTLKLSLVLAIFFYWVSPLIIWLVNKDSFSDKAVYEIKKLLNFEIMLSIILIAICFVPFVNFAAFLASPIAFIVNIVVCIKACKALDKNEDYIYPINVQLIN